MSFFQFAFFFPSVTSDIPTDALNVQPVAAAAVAAAAVAIITAAAVAATVA